MKQTEIVSIEDLVSDKHPYRAFKKLLNFDKIAQSVAIEEHDAGANGYGKVRLVLCLVLQFVEDLSDCQPERFLAENNACK